MCCRTWVLFTAAIGLCITGLIVRMYASVTEKTEGTLMEIDIIQNAYGQLISTPKRAFYSVNNVVYYCTSGGKSITIDSFVINQTIAIFYNPSRTDDSSFTEDYRVNVGWAQIYSGCALMTLAICVENCMYQGSPRIAPTSQTDITNTNTINTINAPKNIQNMHPPRPRVYGWDEIMSIEHIGNSKSTSNYVDIATAPEINNVSDSYTLNIPDTYSLNVMPNTINTNL